MAASNKIVTLLPPDKRDATLVAQCAASDRLEHAPDQSEHTDRCNRSLYDSAAEVDELHGECDELVATLCQCRARTLVRITARLRTLLYFSPQVSEPSDTECWDVRMVGVICERC